MMILYLPDNKEISGNRKELMELKKMIIMVNRQVCGEKYSKPARQSLTHLKNNSIDATLIDSGKQLKYILLISKEQSNFKNKRTSEMSYMYVYATV